MNPVPYSEVSRQAQYVINNVEYIENSLIKVELKQYK